MFASWFPFNLNHDNAYKRTVSITESKRFLRQKRFQHSKCFCVGESNPRIYVLHMQLEGEAIKEWAKFSVSRVNKKWKSSFWTGKKLCFVHSLRKPAYITWAGKKESGNEREEERTIKSWEVRRLSFHVCSKLCEVDYASIRFCDCSLLCVVEASKVIWMWKQLHSQSQFRFWW